MITTLRVVCSLSVLMLAAGACLSMAQAPAVTATADAPPATAQPRVDPEADRIFRAACAYLAQARSLSFKSEEWVDVALPSGQKIQTTRHVSVTLKRPDRLQIDVVSPRHGHGIWYSEGIVSYLDRSTNLYASAPAADTVDKTIDAIEERFGINFPMADLLVEDPFASAMAGTIRGVHLGKATVLGVPCRHLAFSGQHLDWQIWIQEGAKPLPRKIVLTYKNEPGTPQRTAILSDWDLAGPHSDSVFGFVPPRGARKVDLRPLDAPATSPADARNR